MANESNNEIKMVSKLSMKNAGVSPKQVHALPEGKTSLPLARIFGLADGVKRVEDARDGKVYLALIGRFQALSPTGTITRSGVLYLPSGIHENYVAEVQKLDEGSALQFAIEMRAVKADNPAGYSYEAIDLTKPVETSPLDSFMHEIQGSNSKVLPAPAPAPAPAPVPTQATKKR